MEISLLLGRPFLAMSGTHIDVQQGKLTMRVQDIKVTFEVQFLYFLPKVQSCAQLNDLKPTRTEPYIALELD